MFDPTKPTATRDGRPVRILATDALGAQPIVGLIGNGVHELPARRYADGRALIDSENPADFINVPVRSKAFFCVCDPTHSGTVSVRPSVDELRAVVSPDPAVVGIVEVTFEDGQPVSAQVIDR